MSIAPEQNAGYLGNTEIVSGELTLELLNAELAYVVEALSVMGAERVHVTHWMGKTEVAVLGLLQAFQDGFEAHGFFQERLGSLNDFSLFADGVKTQFEFCHHKELHVISDDAILLERFFSRWQSLGYNTRQLPSS